MAWVSVNHGSIPITILVESLKRQRTVASADGLLHVPVGAANAPAVTEKAHCLRYQPTLRHEDPMKHIVQTTRLAAVACLACAALAGCVVAPARPYYGSEVVAVAPPPPREEFIGVAPAPGYIWIGGYWGWTGGRH